MKCAASWQTSLKEQLPREPGAFSASGRTQSCHAGPAGQTALPCPACSSRSQLLGGLSSTLTSQRGRSGKQRSRRRHSRSGAPGRGTGSRMGRRQGLGGCWRKSSQHRRGPGHTVTCLERNKVADREHPGQRAREGQRGGEGWAPSAEACAHRRPRSSKVVLAAEQRLEHRDRRGVWPSTEGGGQRRWPGPAVSRGRSEVLFLRQSERDLVMDWMLDLKEREEQRWLREFHLSG